MDAASFFEIGLFHSVDQTWKRGGTEKCPSITNAPERGSLLDALGQKN